MTTARKKQPRLTAIRTSYSVGVKVNLGNFESADFRLSLDETWDVSDLTVDQTKALNKERYEYMRDELGKRIEKEAAEALGVDYASREEAAQ